MVEVKISGLPAAAAASVAQELEVNDSGTSKRLSVQLLMDLLGMQKAVLGSQHSISSATATEVAGLQVTLPGAGTYAFKYVLICQSSATGTGLKFGVNYTGTTTKVVAVARYPSTGTTASTGIADDVAAVLTGSLLEAMAARSLSTTAPNLGPFTGVATANADLLVVVEGVIVVTDGGDLELWHGSEGAVATSVEVGSGVLVTKLG